MRRKRLGVYGILVVLLILFYVHNNVDTTKLLQDVNTEKELTVDTSSEVVTDSTVEKLKNLNTWSDKITEKFTEFLSWLGLGDASAETVSTDLENVTLVRVVDGDTIVVINSNGAEKKIRFIGIDTPESVHVDETKNTEYGVMASDYTKDLLENTTELYLQYDEEAMDQYGRTLAYVWTNSEVDTTSSSDIERYMLNAILVKNGYAKDKVYEPNDAYADKFEKLCIDAKNNGTGLWQYDGFAALWEE